MVSAYPPVPPPSHLPVGGFAIPIGSPVADVDGVRIGRAIAAIDDCLVVRHDEVYEDHIPFDAVAAFDGNVVHLAVTADEVHRGEAQRHGTRTDRVPDPRRQTTAARLPEVP